MTPEFSRTYRLDSLGGLKTLEIEASADERAALAQRFGLQDVAELKAQATVTPVAAGIEVAGHMKGRATQSCVVTGGPVPAFVSQNFAVRFVAPDATPEAEEIELNAEDCDIMEHDGQAIDIGEAVAQTLGLALDPYPRSANAEARLREAGVLAEGEAGPFGALAALRDKLQGK
jgi:uncharacterized metal-binding protein YceD (DUF177 family)